MLSKATVKEALHTFVNELEECLRYQCYLAAALMAITVPDICAAAEADDGEASSQRYRKWCTRYLNDAFLSGEEWYDLCCVILHQGRTLARSKAVRYRRYVLSLLVDLG
jgi:hypothetical protein